MGGKAANRRVRKECILRVKAGLWEERAQKGRDSRKARGHEDKLGLCGHGIAREGNMVEGAADQNKAGDPEITQIKKGRKRQGKIRDSMSIWTRINQILGEMEKGLEFSDQEAIYVFIRQIIREYVWYQTMNCPSGTV